MLRGFILFLLLGMVCASGCSKQPRIHRVTGTVTRNNEPVPNLIVRFFPEHGRPSWGQTNAQGEFELQYDLQTKGAVEGKHKVFIEFMAADPGEEHALKTGTSPEYKDRKALAEKYNEANSPLQAVVEKDNQKIHLQIE